MLDCVPGDVASSVVIATAAATGSGWELIGSGGGAGSDRGREGQRRWRQRACGGDRAQHQQGGQVMVVHAASSTVNPIINLEVHEVGRAGRERRDGARKGGSGRGG